MRFEFEMACFEKFGLLNVETSGKECAVEIEPDEATCLTSWYVARVYMEGRVSGKLCWLQISERDLRFEQISKYAQTYHANELAKLWDDYLADHPIRAVHDRDEHRTHGGSL